MGTLVKRSFSPWRFISSCCCYEEPAQCQVWKQLFVIERLNMGFSKELCTLFLIILIVDMRSHKREEATCKCAWCINKINPWSWNLRNGGTNDLSESCNFFCSQSSLLNSSQDSVMYLDGCLPSTFWCMNTNLTLKQWMHVVWISLCPSLDACKLIQLSLSTLYTTLAMLAIYSLQSFLNYNTSLSNIV